MPEEAPPEELLVDPVPAVLAAIPPLKLLNELVAVAPKGTSHLKASLGANKPDRSHQLAEISKQLAARMKQIETLSDADWKALRADRTHGRVKPMSSAQVRQIRALADQLAGLISVLPAMAPPKAKPTAKALKELHQLVRVLVTQETFAPLARGS